MKVLHVISSISRTGGGPARSVQGLVAGLNDAGVDAWLLTLRHGEEPWVEGVKNFANGELFENVVARIRPDIVHLHGLWSIGLHRCAVICRRWRIPYVIAPRGMLEPWSLKQKWLKKRIARWLYQDRDLKCAAALHATAESEEEQFRGLGFKNPIIISPNGVNVPDDSLFSVPRSPFPPAVRRVLFVSRMHPKKGVLELVEAWGKLVVSGQSLVASGWVCELVYTVNGEIEQEYEAKVKARVKELGLQDQFVFTGALNDEEKWSAYARADLFVLPTYSENFGIVVAEALWAGVPVITTKGTPWSELEGNSQLAYNLNHEIHGTHERCPHIHSRASAGGGLTTNDQPLSTKSGWWIDIGVEPLANSLGEAMSIDDATRREMGERGRKLVEEKYTWDAVVKKMIEGYESIICKGQEAR